MMLMPVDVYFKIGEKSLYANRLMLKGVYASQSVYDGSVNIGKKRDINIAASPPDLKIDSFEPIPTIDQKINNIQYLISELNRENSYNKIEYDCLVQEYYFDKNNHAKAKKCEYYKSQIAKINNKIKVLNQRLKFLKGLE